MEQLASYSCWPWASCAVCACEAAGRNDHSDLPAERQQQADPQQPGHEAGVVAGGHRSRKIVANNPIHTTSTKCQ